MFILFLIIIKKLFFSSTNSNTYNSNPLQNNSYKYDGYDYTYLKNETQEQNELYKINRHFANKRVLDILKDENVSINTKLILLKDNRIKASNLFAGGLMKDFDFDFD